MIGKFSTIRIVLLLLFFSEFGFAQQNCDQKCKNLRDTIARLKRSVVSVFTYDTTNKDAKISEKFFGLGSGFFYKKCNIITNSHVVGESEEIGISIPGTKKGRRATVIANDKRMDIAVLRLDKPYKCKPIKSANFRDFALGTPVISVGNPMGLGWSVTSGIISADNRSLGPKKFHRYIQSDAVIFPGNSGGPLLTLSGELLGINTIATINAGLGFAFPSYIMDRILPELISHTRLRPRYLGIKAKQNKNADKVSFEDYFAGVKVAEVTKGSPAFKAGIRKNDILIRFDGHEIKSLDDLEMELYSHRIGSVVNVEALVKGKKLEES